MDDSLLLLALLLIGVGVTTTGMLLLFSGSQGSPRVAAGSHARRVAVILAGGALSGIAWVLGGTPPDKTLDIDALLKQAPPAAGIAPARFRHISIMVDASPRDDGPASASRRHAYSSRLAESLATAVVATGISGRADPMALPAEHWPGTEKLVQCKGEDLVVRIEMQAVQLGGSGEYALWREPRYELHWCDSGRRSSHVGRVLERTGDALPYEQAMRGELLQALRNAPAG